MERRLEQPRLLRHVGQAIPGKASVNPVSIILSSLPPDSSSFDSRRRGQDKRESAAGGGKGLTLCARSPINLVQEFES